VVYTMPAEYGVLDTYVNRYRGIELPFGHVWKITDGINVRIYADIEPTPISEAFITDDPSLWNDTNYIGYTKIGEIPRVTGWISDMIDGELMPSNSVGGGSTTYWCDLLYTMSPPVSGESLRIECFGGSATTGLYVGLGISYLGHFPDDVGSYIGTRLCYIPN